MIRDSDRMIGGPRQCDDAQNHIFTGGSRFENGNGIDTVVCITGVLLRKPIMLRAHTTRTRETSLCVIDPIETSQPPVFIPGTRNRRDHQYHAST